MKEISRFELIGKDGRQKVLYEKMLYSIQDNGKTLKVFRVTDSKVKDGK